MVDKNMYLTLIDKAISAREHSYSPYSKFKVGASILCDDSKIFSGCNVENVSYGGSNCAERTAIFKAVSEGYNKIYALCVVGSFEDYTYPCGICRQVMIEFAYDNNIPIIVAKNKEEYMVHNLKEILPFGFTKNNLI